jgi:hypothetical protein
MSVRLIACMHLSTGLQAAERMGASTTYNVLQHYTGAWGSVGPGGMAQEAGEAAREGRRGGGAAQGAEESPARGGAEAATRLLVHAGRHGCVPVTCKDGSRACCLPPQRRRRKEQRVKQQRRQERAQLQAARDGVSSALICPAQRLLPLVSWPSHCNAASCLEAGVPPAILR